MLHWHSFCLERFDPLWRFSLASALAKSDENCPGCHILPRVFWGRRPAPPVIRSFPTPNRPVPSGLEFGGIDLRISLAAGRRPRCTLICLQATDGPSRSRIVPRTNAVPGGEVPTHAGGRQRKVRHCGGLAAIHQVRVRVAEFNRALSMCGSSEAIWRRSVTSSGCLRCSFRPRSPHLASAAGCPACGCRRAKRCAAWCLQPGGGARPVWRRKRMRDRKLYGGRSDLPVRPGEASRHLGTRLA